MPVVILIYTRYASESLTYINIPFTNRKILIEPYAELIAIGASLKLDVDVGKFKIV